MKNVIIATILAYLIATGAYATVAALSSYEATMTGEFECEVVLEEGSDVIVIERCVLSNLELE